MNRSLYYFGIFFSVLTTISGLLQSVIYLRLGGQIFMLESFIGWFVVVNIISLICSLFILKYYHYKNFRFAFYAGLISVFANLVQGIILFIILVAGKLQSYYIPVVYFNLSTGIIYAIGLIFSNAAQRRWLKIAGILIFVTGCGLLFSTIWSMSSQDPLIKSMLEKITQWTLLVGNLLAVLYILNFFSEIKILKTENSIITPRKSLENLMWFVGIVSFSFALALGVLVVTQSYSQLYWQNKNAEKTLEFVQRCDARSFINSNGDILQYLLLAPLDYDPLKKYPLVLCLPYGGYETPAGQLLAEDMNRKKYPAFIFVPDCPPGKGWGGIPNYPTIDTLVFDAIHALEKEVDAIDAKRRYVTGISRGGYGSWHFICTRPEMFAAAIPVCGGGDPKRASSIVGVSIWAFHGEKDKNVPVSGSRDMIEGIKKAGGDPRYTEFQGEGHNIWGQVTATPGLWDWLFAQKRN